MSITAPIVICVQMRSFIMARNGVVLIAGTADGENPGSGAELARRPMSG